MKKFVKYFGVLLTFALLGAFSACNIAELEPTDDLGLNIKVFFPTKVVPGSEMTINGSGFSAVKEIVFPDNVRVTDFKVVSNEMIRVTAPAGFSAQGGKLIVRTADEEAESRLPLTLGHTEISGFSKQEGETIKGGEQLTIYGKDLEFISGVELLDKEGTPSLIDDACFYRKGTSTVIIYIPKKVFDGTFVGKVYTFDGKVFDMPELVYEPASEGGHWETVKTSIWKNDGSHGEVGWDGTYRFAPESNPTGEEIYTIPQEIWDKMKSGTFYLLAQGSDWVQMRITTGWWSTTWTGDDIMTGNERIIDNGDGTFYIEINFEGDPILDVLDAQHLLFTGSGYTPLEIYFSEDIWVDGGGHWEIVKTPIWKNDGSFGMTGWDGTYRFAPESNPTGEEIYTIPQEIWDKMKSGPFYLLAQGSDWVQMRITTGWWSTTWTGDDIMTGDDRIIDNGDGTFYIVINFDGDPILDYLDAQHLLFTGSGYTPLEIYFQEEVWVDDGGGPGHQEVVFWENDGSHGMTGWDGTYRFGLEGHDFNSECIATLPEDVWNIIKSGTFYLLAQGSDWVQMRITTGWWSTTWTGDDIMTGDDRIIDNGDGTYYIEISFGDDPIVGYLDDQHLLFTGSGYTPLKLYYTK